MEDEGWEINMTAPLPIGLLSCFSFIASCLILSQILTICIELVHRLHHFFN